MTDARIKELGDALWFHVFSMLDGEPELDGHDAGQVAAAVQKRFQEAIAELDA